MQLLARTPKTRLGTQGAEEVKSHPFFAEIDWEELAARNVPPPFKPITTGGDLDVTNIDEEFKNQSVKDTPVVPSTLRSKVIMFEKRRPL